MALLFDNILSPTTNKSSSIQNSTSYQTTNANQYTYSPSTNSTQSLILNLGSPNSSIGSNVNPSFTPSTSLVSNPSSVASQDLSAKPSSTSSTDSVATYVLIGGALLGAFFLFKGGK